MVLPGLLYATTAISRSATQIMNHIQQAIPHLNKPSTNLLFTLSGNLHAHSLAELAPRLASISSGETIGCISAPLPTHLDSITCSIAVFDAESTKGFRSNIPGKEAPQVGRWHAFRKKNDRDAREEMQLPGHGEDWEAVWKKSMVGHTLPEGLDDVQHKPISTILYLTDDAPEGLENSLAAFPDSFKLGLFASPTPFLTGRPVTLFHNKSIYSSGAVGLALFSTSSPTASVHVPGVQLLGQQHTVTSSEGNLVKELDFANPASLLLKYIRESGIEHKQSFQEDDFYLITHDHDGKLSQVHRINSGDPSRGIIALDAPVAPAEGSKVQFCSRNVDNPAPASEPNRDKLSFSFTASSSALNPQVHEGDKDEALQTLDGAFVSASENGFSFCRPSISPWRCTWPGSSVTLK